MFAHATCMNSVTTSIVSTKFNYAREVHQISVISGFRRSVNEVFVFFGCYASLIVSLLPTFRASLGLLDPRYAAPKRR
jgi:hypothetical protein